MKAEPSTSGEGVTTSLSTKQVGEFNKICVVYEEALEKLDTSMIDIEKYPLDIPLAVAERAKELRGRYSVEHAELNVTIAETTYDEKEAKELKGKAKNANADAVQLFKKAQSLTKESRGNEQVAAASEA